LPDGFANTEADVLDDERPFALPLPFAFAFAAAAPSDFAGFAAAGAGCAGAGGCAAFFCCPGAFAEFPGAVPGSLFGFPPASAAAEDAAMTTATTVPVSRPRVSRFMTSHLVSIANKQEGTRL
jgi:hypothetical protein